MGSERKKEAQREGKTSHRYSNDIPKSTSNSNQKVGLANVSKPNHLQHRVALLSGKTVKHEDPKKYSQETGSQEG